MAELRVAFKNGKTEIFTIPEAADIKNVYQEVALAFNNNERIGLGIESEYEDLPIYAMLWIRMDEANWFAVDGFVDDQGIEEKFGAVSPDDLID